MTVMKRTLKLAYTVTLFLVVVSPNLLFTVGAQGGPPSQNIPVTSTIDGLGVDTLPTLRIQSDQLGSYQDISSKHSTSLRSGITDKAWLLDMLNNDSSPQRKVLIDLRDPVPGSGPNGGPPVAPFAYQLVRARFLATCTDPMQSMQPNDIFPCSMAVQFDDASGVGYHLVQNPGSPNYFTETNWVNVTCVATDANAKCNQWKIEPSATQFNGEIKNVAKLVKRPTRPNQSGQDMGDFYVSFTIHLTNP